MPSRLNAICEYLHPSSNSLKNSLAFENQLKVQLLLFDRIGLPFLFNHHFQIFLWDFEDHHEIVKRLDTLVDKGYIYDPLRNLSTDFIPSYELYESSSLGKVIPKISDKQYHLGSAIDEMINITMAFNKTGVVRPIEIYNQELQKWEKRDLRNLWQEIIRLSAIFLNLEEEYTESIPFFNNLEFQKSEFYRKSSVTRLVINQFPVISESSDWNKVFELKEDENAKVKLRNLRIWINKVSRDYTNMKELNLELESLIHDYEQSLKLLKFKVFYKPLRILLPMVQGFISGIPASTHDYFNLFDEQVNLLESEMNLRGREVAYLIELKNSRL
jgi:hypothetical protein